RRRLDEVQLDRIKHDAKAQGVLIALSLEPEGYCGRESWRNACIQNAQRPAACGRRRDHRPGWPAGNRGTPHWRQGVESYRITPGLHPVAHADGAIAFGR